MAGVAPEGETEAPGERPAAVTFDFWNTLVAQPAGTLAAGRREAVVVVLEEGGFDLDPAALDRHLAAAGAAHQIAWEGGGSFHPREGARTLVDGLALGDPVLGDAVAAAFLDAGRDAELALAPGAAATLAALDRAGIRLGIVCDVGLTGSPHLRGFLERAGVLGHFSGWAFSDEVGAFKPDPAIFGHVLDRLGIADPGSAWHVGDLRRTDVAGARAAGLTAVRYRGLADDRSELPEADRVIDELSELPAAVGA